MKNALTVGTNIKLSFLKDRDPPLHTGGPPADVAEDEAEEVGGGHIDSHHYLGLVGERKGREAEHTFSYLHHPHCQPKHSPHCSQSNMPQREEETSTGTLLLTAPPDTVPRSGDTWGQPPREQPACGRGWEGCDHTWRMLWHSSVAHLSWGTHSYMGKVQEVVAFVASVLQPATRYQTLPLHLRGSAQLPTEQAGN